MKKSASKGAFFQIIAVTGTPGTGKTTFAKKFAQKGEFFYLDVTKLIKKNKLYNGYDRKRKCYVVDVKELNKHLIKIFKEKKSENLKGIVIDSHLSHYLQKKYVDLCIVTKCSLKTLQKRLKKRGYSKAKIRENLDAEIFDVCLNEAKEMRHKVKVEYT